MAFLFSLSNNLFLQFSFLFFSLSYLLHHSSAGIQHPLCHGEDRSSLLQFKESFVFDEFSCDSSIADYTKLSSWKDVADHDDCCSWDGVDCDDETGHVIGIDLSSSCLYGSINSSSPLFRLVHLTYLDLSYNNFNLSIIPGGIRNLSELKHLNLSYANFCGQIPPGILELSQLASLCLLENQLILHKPSLEDVVEKLTNISQLDLTGVNISSNVPLSFSNLTTLSYLRLENCSLQGGFPLILFQLPNLHHLNLRYNSDLTGYLPEFQVGSPLERLALDWTNFSGQLPLSIGNLRSLSFFSISRCGFGGLIPSSIGNLTKLNVLDLTENYFTGNIPYSSLGNLLQLTFLRLSFNNFTSGTLHWLGELSNLQYLNLEETNSYGAIPFSFRNMTQLTQLRLHRNQLTGQIPSNSLGNCTQLTNLYLSYNELQGPIPESIFRLPNIEEVDLQSNNLSGSLRFDSFLQSKYLSVLQLSNNHLSLVNIKYMNVTLPKFQALGLSGCNLREFPAFLRGQHQLENLELNHNHIKGYVPSWIFTFVRLCVLLLGDNFLQGFEHSPNVTLTSTNLQFFDLSSNEFVGPLPIPPPSIGSYIVAQNEFSGDVSSSFCDLTFLLLFDLSDNNLSGNFPPCLGNLARSTLLLSLRKNFLSGKIPDNFTSGCALKVMDFSQNTMEGEVPRSLANCSNLEILSLENNRMNDVFPSWLGILPCLRILSLRSNMFHGAIGQPLSQFQFNRLQIIDLSHNHFSGKLPMQYFRNWVSMKSVDDHHLAYMKATISLNTSVYVTTIRYPYFIRIVNKGSETSYDQILDFFVVVDLSSNKFEGEIPETIGTLRALQSLNLSNNILTGHIPSSLENLKELEALDLSTNKLSGDIPPQLTLLTFLSIFNVSHNNLIGPVPQGNQFGTFQNESFSANPGLCGMPLSKKCGDTGTLSLPPSKNDKDEESPFELYWEIMLAGFGSGLVIGISWGYATNTRKYEWLVRRKFARWRKRRRTSRRN